MKIIYNCWFALCMLLLITSCNDEWKDEQYRQYISFKAPIKDKDNGVTPIYVRYNPDGKVRYQLPVIVSGSTTNEQDIDVHVALYEDTLEILNRERFSGRTDLWYTLLEEDKYEFPEIVHIPAGTCVEQLNIDFDLRGNNMTDKWVLPLTIVDDASYNYQGHPRKNYAKALLRVIPFNDYSGSYSTSTMEVYIRNANGSTDNKPMVTNNRTAYVVDNNTIFFYAGLMSEDLSRDERELYKIYIRFNEDKSLSMWADNEEKIGFKLYGTPAYSVTETMDATRPYLKHRYVSFTIEFDFKDVTSRNQEVLYKVKGTMLLERNLNTQIPDEDQQIEW